MSSSTLSSDTMSVLNQVACGLGKPPAWQLSSARAPGGRSVSVGGATIMGGTAINEEEYYTDLEFVSSLKF